MFCGLWKLSVSFTLEIDVEMSKFVDKLQGLSKHPVSLGFHSPSKVSTSLPMLLIAELSDTSLKEAKALFEGVVDAGLISKRHVDKAKLKQLSRAMGKIPLGVDLEDATAVELADLKNTGCDFVIFNLKTPIVALAEEDMGKLLSVPPTLDGGLIKAINEVPLDGVFIGNVGEPFITLEHLLACQRLGAFLTKPVVVTLPSLVTDAELASLWQAGVDAVVLPSPQTREAFMRLREMIANLPKRHRIRQGREGVSLPHYVTDLEDEEDA